MYMGQNIVALSFCDGSCILCPISSSIDRCLRLYCFHFAILTSNHNRQTCAPLVNAVLKVVLGYDDMLDGVIWPTPSSLKHLLELISHCSSGSELEASKNFDLCAPILVSSRDIIPPKLDDLPPSLLDYKVALSRTTKIEYLQNLRSKSTLMSSTQYWKQMSKVINSLLLAGGV